MGRNEFVAYGQEVSVKKGSRAFSLSLNLPYITQLSEAHRRRRSLFRFCRVARDGGQQIYESAPKGHAASASPEAQSEAPKRSWEPGQQQPPGPESQDNQHNLNRPGGVFC